jgi:glycosyltransferase involved in cell wall biosynthesis
MRERKTPLTVTLITLNEERNITRALASIRGWADDIVVIDSGSTDATCTIAESFGARVIHHPWPGFGAQKNFAQDQARQPWILNLDADEELTDELRQEIDQFLAHVEDGSENAKLVRIPRKTRYMGRWILHGGWYPNHLVRLAHREFARWSEPALHEAWIPRTGTAPATATLRNPLLHHTFADIEDQVRTNLVYSRRGYEDLKTRGTSSSILRLIFKPIGKFLETYIFKLGILDGIPGFVISINAAHSMFLRYAYFYDAGESIPPRQEKKS